MRLLFALLLISTTALCQKVDTLKLPPMEAQKIEAIDKELKELQKDPEVQRLFMLQAIRETVIESGFNHKGIPVPVRKEYSNGNTLYIKDEKK